MGLKDNWKNVAGLIARQHIQWMVDGTEGAGTGESIAIAKLLHFEQKITNIDFLVVGVPHITVPLPGKCT